MRRTTYAVRLTTVAALIALIFMVTGLLLTGCRTLSEEKETGTQEHGSREIDATSTTEDTDTTREPKTEGNTEPKTTSEPRTETETDAETETETDTETEIETETDTQPGDEDPPVPYWDRVWSDVILTDQETVNSISILQIPHPFSSVVDTQDYAENWDDQARWSFLGFLREYDISFEPAVVPVSEVAEQLYYSYSVAFSTADTEDILEVSVGRNGLLYIFDGTDTYRSTVAIQYVTFLQFVGLL